MDYNHYMCDIETTGLNSQRHAITEIAVVPFDFELLRTTGELHTSAPFIAKNLCVPVSRSWDQDTLAWRQQRGLLHEGYVDYYDMLEDLHSFVRQLPEKAYFWAKPSVFDWPFVDGYYKEFLYRYKTPWHRRNIRDMATFCHTINPEFDVYSLDTSKYETHTGLGDCLLQLHTMQACVISARKE